MTLYLPPQDVVCSDVPLVTWDLVNGNSVRDFSVTYDLTGGNDVTGQQVFSVVSSANQKAGIVCTSGYLDYATQSEYTMLVHARTANRK